MFIFIYIFLLSFKGKYVNIVTIPKRYNKNNKRFITNCNIDGSKFVKGISQIIFKFPPMIYEQNLQ